MQALVIATHNTHKTEEIRALLESGIPGIRDLTSYPEISPAEETGTTFEENATIKALAASEALGPETTVLADDSGLDVDALGGAPGVYSARYAGPNASDAENREKLLIKLGDAPERSARFRCVMVLAKAGEVMGVFNGSVEGRIAAAEMGEGGFGYDPVFIPEGYEESFGQLSAALKNSMSHRARALAKVAAFFGVNE